MATDKSSFLFGLVFLKQLITVDTIMTPPVTIGYCREASTFASAITNKKLASLLVAPLAEAMQMLFAEGLSLNFKPPVNSRYAKDITKVERQINTVYPAALTFGADEDANIFEMTPAKPFKTNTPR